MELRIKEIRVLGLFGMFDHVIPLNLDSHITIVYGENGIGKTMIFRILNALFEMDFQKLGSLPFGSLELDFAAGGWLKIQKQTHLIVTSSILSGPMEIPIQSRRMKSIEEMFERAESLSSDGERQFREELLGQIREISLSDERSRMERMYYDLLEGKSLRHILRSYSVEVRDVILMDIEPFAAILFGEKPRIADELGGILESLRCWFIGINRLYSTAEESEEKYFDLPPRVLASVSIHSSELASAIREKHVEYQKKSDQLELSLRKRLASGELSPTFGVIQLRELLEEVSKLHRELREAGLWDEAEQESVGYLEELNDVSRAILGVNLVETLAKLEVFAEMKEKLLLLLEIVNQRRFSHKRMGVHPKMGFVFTNDMGERLSLEDLSSGEQHELILLYQLLFKVPKNALILIDEPEISLHVEWQKAFIHDMSEIIRLRGFDIMLATHSPSIINGNWDYTVSLKGKELVHG